MKYASYENSLEKIAKIINLISIKEFEVLVKNLPMKAINGVSIFNRKLYQLFQEKIIQIPQKFFEKNRMFVLPQINVEIPHPNVIVLGSGGLES